jgi:zinc protease
MKRAWFEVGGAALIVACAPSPPALHVPGPTTSHPQTSATTSADAPPLPVTTVAKRDATSRVVALRVAFTSGSADDPPGKEGLTHLTATSMAEGGTQTRTYAELVEKLYPMAASIDVHVDRDETVFFADVATDALEAFYPLFKEVLLTPRLDEPGFERMRARATSELTDELLGANDEALGKEALAAALYEGHPYGHPPVGTERGLRAATSEDVRSHRTRVFCRDRALLGVEGGFPEGFESRFTQDFAALPACPEARAELPEPSTPSDLRVLIIDKPSADSTAISMGLHSDFTRKSSDFPAMEFFTDYVGLHRQSAGRLYHELRERRGFNYGDYAYAEYFEQDGGSRFALPNLVRRQEMVSIWLRPVRPKNAIFALRGALYLFAHAVDGGIPEAEIDRFRSFLIRYTSLEELTESRRLGHALDDVLYGSDPPYLERLREAWKRLDETSLKATVGHHLRGKSFQIAIVTKDGAALADRLVSGAPTFPSYDTPKPQDVLDQDKDIARYPLGLHKDRVRVVAFTDLFK